MKHFSLTGSLTVEASLLMPIMILLLAGLLTLTVNLYQSTVKAADDLTCVEKVDGLDLFLRSAWQIGKGGE